MKETIKSDMNNKLTVIMGNAELIITNEPKDSDQLKHATRILKASKNLAKLVAQG